MLAADAGVETLYYAAGGGGGDFGFDDRVGLEEQFGDLVATGELETVEVPTGEGEIVDTLGCVFVGRGPDAVVLLAEGFEGFRVDASFEGLFGGVETVGEGGGLGGFEALRRFGAGGLGSVDACLFSALLFEFEW